MMLAEKPQFRKWITLSAVLGFIAFLCYLFFFTDFAEVAIVIEGTSIPIYVLVFICVIVGSVFDALAWKSTLDALRVKTTFTRIFSLSWVGHFVDTIVPGGLAGDAFKTYLLTKDKDVNGSKAVASIVIKDVLELLVVMGSLVVGIVLLVLNYSVDSEVMTAIGITMILLALPMVLIVYLSMNVQATEKILRAIQHVASKVKGKETSAAALQEKVHSQITEFHDGFMSMKNNPKGMVRPVVFQTFTWIFEVIGFFLVFIAVGHYIGIDKVVITDTIVSNVQGQGVALAGISQIVSSGLYTGLGITAEIAVASSLLAGFATFWFKLVLSFGFFQTTVFERCIPIFCRKCMGWTAWRTKSCPEPKPKKQSKMPWSKREDK
jgi:uncharacterized protein (TIRG00374 family)